VPARATAARAAAWGLPAAFFASGCSALLGLTDVPEPTEPSSDSSDSAPVSAVDASGAPDDASDATLDAGAAVDSDASTAAPFDTAAPEASPCAYCRGGLCSMSACQPVALVAPDSGVSPYGLAQDDTFLYWTDNQNSNVERTNKANGETDILTTVTYSPIPIAVDDAGMYWGDSLGLWSCPKAGCSADPSLVAEPMNLGGPVSLALDGVNVYWTEGFGSVLSAAKDGSGPARSLWNGGDAAFPGSTNEVATDGQRVYFTASDGLLRGVAVDGSAPFAIGQDNPRGSYGVALDSENVYWSEVDPSQGQISRASTASLAVVGLASQQHYPGAIATDGTNVYWLATTTDAGTVGAVVGCSLASCTPTTLASGYSSAVAIVVDSQAIYWTDSSATSTKGAIWKIAK
jgi:hypothetical protein